MHILFMTFALKFVNCRPFNRMISSWFHKWCENWNMHLPPIQWLRFLMARVKRNTCGTKVSRMDLKTERSSEEALAHV